MPNRIIKESICTSENIDQLKWFDEVLFYRLIVNCDDYGRFDGRPSVIKSRLFPLKEALTQRNIIDAINRLESAGLVCQYQIQGKPFLYLPTWNAHQIVRAKKSKYPSPDEHLQADECRCMQMNADASKCLRNPIQSESKYEEASPPIIPPLTEMPKRGGEAGVPTVEEVLAYCKENSVNTDGREFHRHYSALGWRAGGKPVANWKALLLKYAEGHPAKRSYASADREAFFVAALRKSYGEDDREEN